MRRITATAIDRTTHDVGWRCRGSTLVIPKKRSPTAAISAPRARPRSVGARMGRLVASVVAATVGIDDALAVDARGVDLVLFCTGAVAAGSVLGIAPLILELNVPLTGCPSADN